MSHWCGVSVLAGKNGSVLIETYLQRTQLSQGGTSCNSSKRNGFTCYLLAESNSGVYYDCDASEHCIYAVGQSSSHGITWLTCQCPCSLSWCIDDVIWGLSSWRWPARWLWDRWHWWRQEQRRMLWGWRQQTPAKNWPKYGLLPLPHWGRNLSFAGIVRTVQEHLYTNVIEQLWLEKGRHVFASCTVCSEVQGAG